jgi:thioredoxin reductase
MTNKDFEVIIVGGSYSGLSAGMALGRALRDVLIIDSGKPCNIQTPHSHNFLTHDGKIPREISMLAKKQVEKYKSIKFYNGLAKSAVKIENSFKITTQTNDNFTAKKLIFATGVKDIMPDINGFSDCWGISVIHCPYCHGYEVKGQKTGILANGDVAFHYAQLISNWTKDLTIFTNGKASMTKEQIDKINRNNIPLVEKEIASLKHQNGMVEEILFEDSSSFKLNAIYARPDFEQHCKISEKLGCKLNEQNLLEIDMFHRTTVENIYACGDSVSPFRSVSNAVSTGNIAGAMVNNSIIEEEF